MWCGPGILPFLGGGGGSGGRSFTSAEQKATATAVKNLDPNCQKVLSAHNISRQTLLNDATTLNFINASPNASGSESVAQIAPALAPYNLPGSLQSIVRGGNAVTLFGPNNSISNTVLLGAQFFLDPLQGNNANYTFGQGTVLVHELLHYASQLTDPQFVINFGILMNGQQSYSSAISTWLQNHCNN
jgi:hypothetical protein